jgi:hypothetical protein
MLFDRRAALIIAGIGALSPRHIMQSRWALDCDTLPHMFLFSFWFLCMALQEKKVCSFQRGHTKAGIMPQSGFLEALEHDETSMELVIFFLVDCGFFVHVCR